MKPDNSNDVANIFKNISPQHRENVVNKANAAGTPFFTMESLTTTTNPLAQIIRMLFLRENITKERFEALHQKMAANVYMCSDTASHSKNNLRTALVKDDPTWARFERILASCGYDLVDISVTLKNSLNNEVFELKRSDIINLIKDNPYPPNINITRVDRVVD